MNLALDLARILAALCIFWFHAGLFIPLPLSAYGEYAVSTFILLAVASAVAFSLPKRTGLGPACHYLGRRIARLMPFYLFINVVVFAISQALPSKLGRPFTFDEFALSSLGLSQYFGRRYLSEVFWFLPFIFQIYLLLALIYPLLTRIAWKAAIPVTFLITWALQPALAHLGGNGVLIMRDWSPLFRLPETILGLMTGLWIVEKLSSRAFVENLALYLLAAILFAGCAPLEPAFTYTFWLPLNGLCVTLVIVAAAVGLSYLLAQLPGATFRTLGRATYPFFLIHGLGMATIYRRVGSSPSAWMAYFVACIAASLALDRLFDPRQFPWTSIRAYSSARKTSSGG
jgi:peptidoglycan/LPS O-acetylase OafA/YrhL